MNSKTRDFVIAASLALIYSVFLSITCICRYRLFNYFDFDLAVHTQSLWSICHGSLQSTILGIPFLGNHMVLILYLISPLYLLWPSAELLLVVQSFTLGAGAVGVFLLARREIEGYWPLILCAAYVLYSPLILMNLYEFHPVALASTFLIFAIYFFRCDKLRYFIAFLVLAMLCQENICLIAVFFGLLSLVQRKTRAWIILPSLLGVIYLVIAIKIMPLFNDKIMFGFLYSHFGNTLPEAAVNMLKDPIGTFAYATQYNRLAFLIILLSPLCFVSLASPSSFIPILPIIAQRLLSSRPTEFMMVYHYQAEFIPFIFFAAILGIRNLLRVKRINAGSALLLLLPVSIIGTFALSRTVHTMKQCCRLYGINSGYDLQYRIDAIKKIPENASVVTTFRYLAYMSNRKIIHSLHHIYSGQYTLSAIKYPVPDDIEYIVLDSFDPLTFGYGGFYNTYGHTNLQALLQHGTGSTNGFYWSIENNLEGFIVLKRINEPSGTKLLEYGGITDSQTNTYWDDFGIHLNDYSLGKIDSNGIASLRLSWIKTRDTNIDCNVAITITDKYAHKNYILSPGYRIWPTFSWPTNTLITDFQRIRMPSGKTDPAFTTVHIKLVPKGF